MLFYMGVSIYVSVIAFLELFSSMSQRKNRILFTVSSLVMLVLSAIRWETGTDWNEYFYYYYHIDSGFAPYGKEDFELGVRAVNVLVRRFGGDFSALQFVWAVLVFLAQMKWMNEINARTMLRNTAFMCLWFLYFANIFTTRSTVAYALLLCALPYALRKKRNAFFFITFFVTIFVHRSCILFCVVYFIANMNLGLFKKLYGYIWIITGAVLVCADGLIHVAVRFLPEAYSYRISYYLNGSEAGSSMMGLVNYLFLYVVFLIFYRSKFCQNELYLKLFNIFSCGLVPYIFGYVYSAHFIRAAWPFMMMAVFLIPMILQELGRSNRVIVFGIAVAYLSLRLISNLNSYYDLYVPFQTIFSKL